MNTFFQNFIGLLLLLFVFEFQAQNFQLSNYSLKEGVPQSQINVIIQDEIGFLWFGTEGGGICRFDGNTFEVWDRSNGLQSNYINDLKWIDGKLYVASDKGLSIKEYNKFINFETDEVYKIGPFKNNIFLATEDGVQVFDGKNIETYSLNEVVNDIEFIDDLLWIATNNGLYKIELDKINRKQFEPILKGAFSSIHLSDQKVYGIKQSGGFIVYDYKTELLKSFYNEDKVLSLAIFNDGLWISVVNKGLLQLSNKTFEVLKRYNQISGIPEIGVTGMFQDKQQNKWVATKGEGVYKLKEHRFRNLFKNNLISSTLATSNAIWFGNDTGLTRINSKGFEKISIGEKVNSIAKFNNSILAGSSNGLAVLDSLRIIDTLSTKDGFVSSNFQKVLSREDKIWVILKEEGISSFSYDTATKTVFNHIHFGKSDGLYDLNIKDFELDAKNALWYVTEKGFFGYIDNNKIQHLGNQLPATIKIEGIEIHDNNIFVGTDADGVWMSPISNNPKFVNITKGTVANSKRIQQLLFDSENNLWVGTTRGVSKIEFKENYTSNKVRHFGFNEGFESLETTTGTSFMDKFNNLYFGTKRGLMVYQTTSLNQSNTKLPIGFTTVEVVYNPIDTINLKHWTNNAKVLNLKPEENHISFHYASVDINNPDAILYRWKLNTDTWSNWSKNNTISFPNLNAGDYVFMVESKSINSKNSNPIAFNFSIALKLVDKTWFRLSVFGFLLLTIIFISWNSIRKIRRKAVERNDKLMLKNHMLALEHKALQLQMNPHFIFNVLNSIKAMSLSDTDKMHIVINNFSLLLRGTLSNSRKDHISLEEEISTLNNYILVEQLIRPVPFEFSVNTVVSEDLEEIMIPSMLVQPFVENAIKHGFGSSVKDAKLEVNFKEQGELLMVEIKDNGIGYFQSQKRVQNVSHESVAVELSKERITTLAGENTLKIIELKNDQSMVIGSSIQFSIPLITDY